MRDIKFRAWDEKHNEMRFDPSGYSGDYAASWSDIVNDNPNLMQYTGLMDKNGVEIYEGDIIHYNREPRDDWTAEVIYFTSEARFGLERTKHTLSYHLNYGDYPFTASKQGS